MHLSTQLIPESMWPEYFADLLRLHAGWRATIEVLRLDLGDQRLTDGLPLRGLRLAVRGPETDEIVIEAGVWRSGGFTHQIGQPRTVWAADTLPGAEEDILITSQDGTTTLVLLRPPFALPQPTRIRVRPRNNRHRLRANR